jgi:arylformamidase
MTEIKIEGVKDADYDNRLAFAASAEAFYGTSTRRSLAFNEANHIRQDFAYGDKPRNRMDFVPGNAEAPTLLHIHGGYWQWNAKEDYSFVGQALHALGLNLAFVEHTLAPDATIDGIVDEIRAGLDWLRGNLAELGVKNRDIVVSGHSSGGHLCARMKGEADVIGIVAMSGLFDLRPIGQIHVNDVVRMDSGQIQRQSPLLNTLDSSGFAIVSHGENELTGFQNQSRAYAEALAAAGAEVIAVSCAGRDHFDVLYELSDEGGAIYRAVAARLGLPA